MKTDCTIDDFQVGDMVSVKKGWTPANSKCGFVISITQDSLVVVKHYGVEIKKYKPNELKNLTGGNL